MAMKLLPASVAPSLLLACFICFFAPTLSSPAVPNNAKPIIVLAPAAWFSPIHYSEYTNQLQNAGYQIVTQRLPSCDSPNPEAQSVAADAAFISRNLLMPSINAGREVVLIMHSYSGGPGAVAAKGLSLAERRAAGRPGGIIGLIFIAAFVAEEGQTLLSSGGGQFAPWVMEYSDGQLGVQGAKEAFFNDVPEPLSDAAVAELKNQSRYSATTPCGPPAWSDAVYNGRRAYVFTTLDNAIPPAGQQFMVQQSKVQWDVETFKTSHAPFLSQPKMLSDWTVTEVSKFQAAGSAGVVPGVITTS